MNVKASWSVMLATAVLVALPTTADAGFRCGPSKIAAEGDTTVQVRMKCGSPLSEENLTNAYGLTVSQRWVYRDPADKRWIKILTFSGGVLQSITETKD